MPEQNLHSSAESVGLHFPEKSAFLAFYTVHYPRNIVHITLILRSVRLSYLQELLNFLRWLIPFQFQQQTVQIDLCFEVLLNILRHDRVVLKMMFHSADAPQ